jgi:tyrosyl-tRNA synthetase
VEIDVLLDAGKTHPMQAKKLLGKDIVAFYHGSEAAGAAEKEWVHRHSDRQDPTDIPEVEVPMSVLTDGKVPAFKLLVALGLAPSNNEARRLVQGGAVTVGPDRTKVSDAMASLDVPPGLIVRVGNRRVVRVCLV